MLLSDLESMIEDARAQGATDDTPVHISYNYGDHWGTQVAPEADDAEMLYIKHSSYHGMDKLTEDRGEEESDQQVLVIS